MSGVREFTYQDLTQRPKAKEAEVNSYQEPLFTAHAPDKATAELVHKKTEGFKLDEIIIDQLGLDEREKAAQEQRIRKEIERRWERAAEKAEVSGYTKGLEEGKNAAIKAEMPRIRDRLEKLDQLLQEFDKFREKIFVANEAFLMELIAEVAGMIVLKEIQLDKEYVKRLVITLLQHLSTKEDIKIQISESDFSNIELLRQALEKEFGKLSNTTIDVSPDIPTGGCKIETRFGVVDATVASQIEHVKEAMKS